MTLPPSTSRILSTNSCCNFLTDFDSDTAVLEYGSKGILLNIHLTTLPVTSPPVANVCVGSVTILVSAAPASFIWSVLSMLSSPF